MTLLRYTALILNQVVNIYHQKACMYWIHFQNHRNYTICLAGQCFYVDLTNVNTKTAFDFVEHYTRSHDSLWGDRKPRNESIVKENISVKPDKLTNGSHSSLKLSFTQRGMQNLVKHLRWSLLQK